MKFFLDTCDISEIEFFSSMGLVDGVTTNPSIIAKSGKEFFPTLREICSIVKTSVSAEVISTEFKGMLKEAETLLKVGEQITIKVPLTFDGLRACRELTKQGHKVNVTLCFNPSQALMAAKAGATYISPFIGRLDDIGQDGMVLIADIQQMFVNYPDLPTELLVASVRNVNHVISAAKIGADIATVPPSVLRDMIKHPLTDSGLSKFLADWKKTGQKIEG
jgi:transaldolase